VVEVCGQPGECGGDGDGEDNKNSSIGDSKAWRRAGKAERA
jgi:hypothetical protein